MKLYHTDKVNKHIQYTYKYMLHVYDYHDKISVKPHLAICLSY